MAGLEILKACTDANDEAERADQRRLDELARSGPRRLGTLADPYREGIEVDLWRACR